METRIYYITQSELVTGNTAIGDFYRPFFNGLGDELNGENGNWWNVVTSNDHTEGVFASYTVSIYTTPENHAILEASEFITRIDNI